MYNAKIVTDAGKTFSFGYAHGVLFDISPLSGADVDIAASQGFRQVGETVEGQSVGGIRRTIRGVVLNDATARRMISALPVFTTGRLYFGEKYFCNIVLQKTPSVSVLKNGKIPFTMQVYCDTPFWMEDNLKNYILNGYTSAFSFPVNYDSHVFGTRASGNFTNCINTGDVEAPFVCEFTAIDEVSGYGIINVVTLEELRFDDTLFPGDVVRVYQENGRVRVQKTSDGVTSNALGLLSEDSTLFNLLPGDNVLKVVADNNEESLQVSLSYMPVFMGVLP